MKRAVFIKGLFICSFVPHPPSPCVCATPLHGFTPISHPHMFSLLRSCITSCHTHYYMSCYLAPPLFPTLPPNQCYPPPQPCNGCSQPSLFPSHITHPSLLPSHTILRKTITKQQVLELLHPHRAEHWCGRHGILLWSYMPDTCAPGRRASPIPSCPDHWTVSYCEVCVCVCVCVCPCLLFLISFWTKHVCLLLLYIFVELYLNTLCN